MWYIQHYCVRLEILNLQNLIGRPNAVHFTQTAKPSLFEKLRNVLTNLVPARIPRQSRRRHWGYSVPARKSKVLRNWGNALVKIKNAVSNTFSTGVSRISRQFDFVSIYFSFILFSIHSTYKIWFCKSINKNI